MGHLTLRRLEILLCSSCAGRINRGLLLSWLGAIAIRDCQKMGASGSLAARLEYHRRPIRKAQPLYISQLRLARRNYRRNSHLGWRGGADRKTPGILNAFIFLPPLHYTCEQLSLQLLQVLYPLALSRISKKSCYLDQRLIEHNLPCFILTVQNCQVKLIEQLSLELVIVPHTRFRWLALFRASMKIRTAPHSTGEITFKDARSLPYQPE